MGFKPLVVRDDVIDLECPQRASACYGSQREIKWNTASLPFNEHLDSKKESWELAADVTGPTVTGLVPLGGREAQPAQFLPRPPRPWDALVGELAVIGAGLACGAGSVRGAQQPSASVGRCGGRPLALALLHPWADVASHWKGAPTSGMYVQV